MSWPSSTDPFYLANTTDNNARRTYYGVNSTPTMKCDGLAASASGIYSNIVARMPIASPLWMDLIMTVNGNTLNVTMKAVSNTSIGGSSNVIHCVLLDRYSYLPSSPNGMPNHYHAMLDMAPSATGQVFQAPTVGDTVTYTASFTLNPSWELTNLDVATFVQYNPTKEILQAKCEQVPVNFPGLYYDSFTLTDNGNNDGRAEPGETASMYITLGNLEPFQPATNVVGTLSTTDPTLTITTANVSFPDILNGGTGTNTNPFIFEVSPSATPHMSSLHLHVVADPLQTVMDVDIDIFIGWPDILLIDDDGTSTFQSYYISTFQNMNLSYEHWDVNVQGTPTLDYVAGYGAMVWFTGFASINTLTATEQTLVQDYISTGGKLFLSGQNIAQNLNSVAPTFLHDVLHANLTTTNTSIRLLDGIAGNPVGDGLTLNCNAGGSGSGSCTHPDGISAIAPAENAFLYTGSAHYGGLTYEGTGDAKLVFFSFPFEAISGQNASSTREEVFQAIWEFFGNTSSYPEFVVNLTYVSGSPVPAGGGNLIFDVYVLNDSGQSQDYDAWLATEYEGGAPTTLVMRSFVNYQAGWAINRPGMFYPVPGGWAAGNYTLNARVGYEPGTVWMEDGFPFVKSGVSDGSDFVPYPVAGAPNPFDVIQTNVIDLPTEYALHGAYPNPFNPTTNINFDLPDAGQVKLAVYDLQGRLVQTLVDGHRNAGVHQVSFDA
ncbi:hypothetical protein KJ564_01530, partial [bacterium]|nr:hypothetical protein [bacterium]